jgi:hypothetical protein
MSGFPLMVVDVKCTSVLVAAARRSPLRKGETPVGPTRQVLPRSSDSTNAISFLRTNVYKCAVDQHGYNTIRASRVAETQQVYLASSSAQDLTSAPKADANS